MLVGTALTLLTQTTVDKVSLSYIDGRFVVREGVTRIYNAAERPEAGNVSIAYRRDNAFAVWDDRGLVTRRGEFVAATKFEAVPTSPRLLGKEAIETNIRLLRSGVRRRPASGISGSVRIGENVVFFPRWDDANGKPWLEAAVRVKLTDPKPKPVVIGVLPGLSGAHKFIDRYAKPMGDWAGIVVKTGDIWGIYKVKPTTDEGELDDIGHDLQWVRASGYVCDREPTGLYALRRIDWPTGGTELLYESREPLELVDDQEPLVAIAEGARNRRLVNLETGALREVPPRTMVLRADQRFIAWQGAAEPVSATLYDPARWLPVAVWSKSGSSERASEAINSTPTGRASSLKSNRG
jgi:hypothetical protein